MCLFLLHCFVLFLIFFKSSFSFTINKFYIDSKDLSRMNQLIIDKSMITRDFDEIYSKPDDLIFLTGASNIMPDYIYSNFIDKLKLNNFNIISPREWDAKNKGFELIGLLNNVKPLSIIGHSSCIKLIVGLCNKYSNIKNVILLDPVDNRFSLNSIYRNLFRKFNPIKLENVKNILIIKAEKSFKFSLRPLNIPFIPIFGFDENNFKSNKMLRIDTITIKDFGHADILDKEWSDFMHNNKICNGNKDRNNTNLNLYHTLVSNIIYKFIKFNTFTL